jgi:hypothetical protein
MWLNKAAPKRTLTVGRLLAGALKPVAGDSLAVTGILTTVTVICPMPYQISTHNYHY